MITDDLTLLSDAQALTSGTIVSTNSIDLGVARDLGAGEQLKIALNVDTTFVGGTSLIVQFITSAAAALTSPTVIGQSASIVTANLAAGDDYVFTVPEIKDGVGQRYFGVQYVITGTYSAGNLTTRIVKDVVNQKDYASGITVA